MGVDGAAADGVARRVRAVDADGRRRDEFLVLQAVAGLPLTVAVVLDLDRALAPLRARMTNLAAAAGAAALLVTALTLLSVWAHVRRRTRHRERRGAA